MSTKTDCSRRNFLCGTGAAFAGLLGGQLISGRANGAEGTDNSQQRLLLSSPLTHSDWMLKPGIAWGPAGVRHMLDMCKASGWSRVHWRVFDGGRTMYHSKLADPQGKWEQDNYHRHHGNLDILQKVESLDYSTFDTLAEAVEYGHKIGLQIYAWISINEDDHGWGIRSRFVKQHPQFRWCKRDGTVYRSQLSFAFPEVMRYKLALVEELIDGYKIDGLFFDWIRTGDVRDNPQNDAQGVADHGYEKPLIDGFKAKYGIDPLTLPNRDDRWVRYRAQPHTEFMRSARKLARGKDLPVSAMVQHPWAYRGDRNKIDGNLRGMLLDTTTWAEEGLIDEIVAAGYYLDGGTPAKAFNALREETKNKVDVVLYCWVPPDAAAFERDFALAQTLGTKQMLFWEADYIDNQSGSHKTETQKAMRARSRML
ncbi:MAG: family 10 glycosylhydrolase [Pirellulales bacterium]|nr:family 10 glycosylhydrolase [Pirellulales bacterium]